MGLFPKALSEYLAITGIPRGPNSQVFIVDPQSGSDSNSGKSLSSPLLTVAAAYALCTANQNDCVVMIGGPTADYPSASIAWSKAYTHLVGWSADLPGVGQRCRIVGNATNDLDTIITISGDGCIFRNVQFFQGNDAAEDSSAAVVSGSRCHFQNVFFAGMGHATAAARAGSYSLGLSGAENTFVRCTIGLASMARTADNTELLMTGECNRNKFIGCEFVAWASRAGKLLVTLDSTAVPYTLQFEDCLFDVFKSNNGATGTAANHAISDGATPYHAIVLRGDCQLIGISAWADPVTYTLQALPVPHANGGISIVGA